MARNALPKQYPLDPEHPLPAADKPHPSGLDAVRSDDASLAALLRDEVMATAIAAREDPCAFFEFVMRRFDKPGEPVEIADHQRLLIEFVEAHARSAVMAPVGGSKTMVLLALTLWHLGRDVELRGAIVSATEAQASEVLLLVRDYVENSAELRLVFPHLRRSTRAGDPWTQSALTVERPRGIKDPSLIAVGLDSTRIVGKRLNWVFVDDVLNFENTATKEARAKTVALLDTQVMSRLDPYGSKACITNTPWHPDDAVHECEKRGWATMRMDILGDVTILDDSEAKPGEEFDSPLIRPAWEGSPVCRLATHDPDPTNQVPLWPEYRPLEWIEARRREHLPHRFNQLYRAQARDDGSAMCKQEYVALCLDKARKLGVRDLAREYRGPNPTFTGVDLAVSPGEESDDTAFFTFEARPDGVKVVLDVECGKWSGPDIMRKLFAKIAAYNSVARVENNAAQQYLISFALDHDVSAPIKGHCTGRTKAHPEHGVPSLFLEMSNGAWAFPYGRRGQLDPHLQRFIDGCTGYSPSRHTDDALMACVAPGALVTTLRGPVKVEDVLVGDRVLTHRGRFRRVTETMSRAYKGIAHRVRGTGNLAFTLTDEHPVWCTPARIETETRRNRVVPEDGGWGFRAVGGLEVGPMARSPFLESPRWPAGKGCSIDLAQFLPIPKKKASRWTVTEDELYWPLNGGKTFKRRLELEDEAAMLAGLYLAEGSIGGEEHIVSFALHRREKHLAKFVTRWMGELFGARCVVVQGNGNGVRVDCRTKLGARFFRRFGKGATKCLPWEWWAAMTPQARLKVARGWMMGDGCYVVQRGVAKLSGVSISRSLLAQVQQAFWAEDYLPTMGLFQKAGSKPFADNPSTCQDSWKIALNQRDTRSYLAWLEPVENKHWGADGTPERRKGVSDRTNSRGMVRGGHTLQRLERREAFTYVGPVYNFHVEGDESYVVEGVAVHNCYFAREQAKKFGALRARKDGSQQGRGAASVVSRIMAR